MKENGSSSSSSGIRVLVFFNVLLAMVVSYFLVKACLQDSKVPNHGQMVGGKPTQDPNPNPFNFLQGFMSLDAKKNKPKPKPMEEMIIKQGQKIHWGSVIGLEGAKLALKEAVEMPLLYSHLFKGAHMKPWSGILLYGPPGTGKSFLAKAAASEINATFFSISAADIMSMYQGESEQRVKNLFLRARENKPSIIFVDEIDSLIVARGGPNENESSRRVKTEFLVQMDGVGKEQAGVLVMGATNTPWALDDALIRRFVKRIYIGLPDDAARERMLKRPFEGENCTVTDQEWKQMVTLTFKYSGADIAALTNDALYSPIRKIASATHVKLINSPLETTEKKGPIYEVCSEETEGAIKIDENIPKKKIAIPPITFEDLKVAQKNNKPSVDPKCLPQYEEWTRKFGKAA